MAVTITFIVCQYPISIYEFVGFQKYLHLTSDFLFAINPLLDTLLYFVLSYCKRTRERDRANTTPIENTQVSNREAAAVITSRLWWRCLVALLLTNTPFFKGKISDFLYLRQFLARFHDKWKETFLSIITFISTLFFIVLGTWINSEHYSLFEEKQDLENQSR